MTNEQQAASNEKSIADDEGWTCKYTHYYAVPPFHYTNGIASVLVYSDGDVYVDGPIQIDRLRAILALPRPVKP